MAKKRTRADARKRRHQRIRRNIYGTSQKPRMNVYRSLDQIYVQVIDDFQGHTLVSASSIDGEIKSKVKNKDKMEQAKIVGETVAERALEKGISEVVFDRGGYKYIGRIAALADGAREGGLKF